MNWVSFECLLDNNWRPFCVYFAQKLSNNSIETIGILKMFHSIYRFIKQKSLFKSPFGKCNFNFFQWHRNTYTNKCTTQDMNNKLIYFDVCLICTSFLVSYVLVFSLRNFSAFFLIHFFHRWKNWRMITTMTRKKRDSISSSSSTGSWVVVGICHNFIIASNWKIYRSIFIQVIHSMWNVYSLHTHRAQTHTRIPHSIVQGNRTW